MPSPLSCSQRLAHSRSSRIACRMEGQLSWQVGSNDVMRGCTGLVTQLLHAHLSVTLPSDASLPRNACHKVLLRLSRLLNVSIAAAGPETHLIQLVSVTWEGCTRWAPSNLRAPQSGCNFHILNSVASADQQLPGAPVPRTDVNNEALKPPEDKRRLSLNVRLVPTASVKSVSRPWG